MFQIYRSGFEHSVTDFAEMLLIVGQIEIYRSNNILRKRLTYAQLEINKMVVRDKEQVK